MKDRLHEIQYRASSDDPYHTIGATDSSQLCIDSAQAIVNLFGIDVRCILAGSANTEPEIRKIIRESFD